MSNLAPDLAPHFFRCSGPNGVSAPATPKHLNLGDQNPVDSAPAVPSRLLLLLCSFLFEANTS